MSRYRPAPAKPQKFHPETGVALRRWICDHQGCDRAPDAPMLKDEVWETISHKRGILCIGHTEELLGRRIAIDDLLDCPGNSFTFLLWDREFAG